MRSTVVRSSLLTTLGLRTIPAVTIVMLILASCHYPQALKRRIQNAEDALRGIGSDASPAKQTLSKKTLEYLTTMERKDYRNTTLVGAEFSSGKDPYGSPRAHITVWVIGDNPSMSGALVYSDGAEVLSFKDDGSWKAWFERDRRVTVAFSPIIVVWSNKPAPDILMSDKPLHLRIRDEKGNLSPTTVPVLRQIARD